MALNQISIEELTNNEFVALPAFEIMYVPHISIIDEHRDAGGKTNGNF